MKHSKLLIVLLAMLLALTACGGGAKPASNSSADITITEAVKESAVSSALEFAKNELPRFTWYDPSGIYAGPSKNYFGPGEESVFISDMAAKAEAFKSEFTVNALLEKRGKFYWMVNGISSSESKYNEEDHRITVHVIYDSTSGGNYGGDLPPKINSEAYITMLPYQSEESGEVEIYYISEVRLIIDTLVDATLK